MKKTLSRAISLAAGLALGCVVVSAFADEIIPPAQREAMSEQATADLLKLNFFADGGGMHLTPNLYSLVEHPPLLQGAFRRLEGHEMLRRWGINWVDGKPVGLFNVPYKNMHVGVLGCVACHSGKAAGRFYVGLGNKNIDVAQIGTDALLAEKFWSAANIVKRKDEDYRYVNASALGFARTLGNRRITNLTEGMVPTSVIRTWFYRDAGLPLPAKMPRSAVKVPALWGYGEKRKVGQFCDGFGNGEHPGWGAAVELVANQKAEVVRSLAPKLESAEEDLGYLLPPKYPYSIDSIRAERGKQAFTRHCAGCHGTYEYDPGTTLPTFVAPKYIDWSIVKTDRDRLDGVSDEFINLVNKSPLNDIVQTTGLREGYFAPRLTGVWARFPYLHNGSVPNIEALLTPAAQRPKTFNLHDAGEEYRFNQVTLGLTTWKPGTRGAWRELKNARSGKRDIYYTERVGHSNQGHEFGFYKDLTDEDRSDLIEYLKTL